MITGRLAVLLILSVPAALGAGEIVRDCATSPETDRKLEALEKWVELKQRISIRPAGVTAAATVNNGMFVLEASPSNSPFRKSIDLENASLFFSRGSGQSFTVSRQPLTYDSSVGTLARSFRKDTSQPGWDVSKAGTKTGSIRRTPDACDCGLVPVMAVSLARGIRMEPPFSGTSERVSLA